MNVLNCFALKTVKSCGSVTRCHKCNLSSLMCFRGQVAKDSKDEAARSTSCNTASSSEPLMRKRSCNLIDEATFNSTFKGLKCLQDGSSMFKHCNGATRQDMQDVGSTAT